MAQLTQEYTDYNKMFNTACGGTSNYNQQAANLHPLAPTQSVQYDGSVRNTISNSNVSGYGPLDFGYGMTPTTTNYSNANVNMSPFIAPNASTAQHHTGQGSAGRRRSSIGNLFFGVVGGDSGGHPTAASSKQSYPKKLTFQATFTWRPSFQR